MNEPESVSRIAEAKARALGAKQKLIAAAAAALVAVFGLAWASHPGSSSSSSATSLDQGSFDEEGSVGEESDDFGGFDSFDSIAPSSGSEPRGQTHVS